MNVDIEYLLGYLQDEFSSFPDVRVSPVAPSGTQRSIDLPQDYDPQANSLHASRGVRVRVGSREFFFPASWVSSGQLTLVQEQAREIREKLGDYGG